MMNIRRCPYCDREVGGDGAWLCGVCGVSWVNWVDGVEMQVIGGDGLLLDPTQWIDVPPGCLLVLKEVCL